MSKHLTPLDVVECLVALLPELHSIAGCHPKSPWGWRRKSAWRDAGDIPHPAMRLIHAHAAKQGIPLTTDHLVWGASWDEVQELLDDMGKPMPPQVRERLQPKVAAE
ncbi:hypothetical protein [Roseovarius atlanticus]|uniref:hypothetical protein n=1 Tax=Roseovarius atlanticus TaxID=1641875 RepID=UPI001C95048F|nr:hypothetical protein [Roseovarius atlanticus]MBY5988191.1 hypothetical protein [Roseovarius atlanticus]MBY6123582.1 hypothetical protein [Roseovarius atlanticus]MBY6148077.1 hypothetical protein [Roseovarius atlanticus]